MTTAICISCGEEKRGAWTLCPSCNHVPEGKTELAKSVLLSDHYLSQSELKAVGDKIKSGETIKYDQLELAELAATLEENPNPLKMPIGCDIRFWLVILFLLIGVLIVLIRLI